MLNKNKRNEKYLRKIKSHGHQRTDHNNCIHDIPELPKVRTGMQYDSQIDDLEEHLHGKDSRERVIELVQDVVLEGVLLDRVLARQSYRTKADDDHYKKIEVT